MESMEILIDSGRCVRPRVEFKEFLVQADRYILSRGWECAGENEIWMLYRHPNLDEMLPLPGAIRAQIEGDLGLCPLIEDYLITQGWYRRRPSVCAGWPVFVLMEMCTFQNKTLPRALLEQLKRDRLTYKGQLPWWLAPRNSGQYH